VVVITGAARGQGRSHAVMLSREGARIVASDTANRIASVPYPLAAEEDLEQTRRLVTDAGGECVTVVADVRDGEAMRGVAAAAIDAFGRIDILLANAGVISFAPGWELTEEQWTDVLAVNLTGAWQSCRAVIPHMIAQGDGGAIVITSSTAGLRGLSNLAHYAAAKHGVVGLMRSLAIELAPHRIRVNTIHPTAVDTDIVMNDAMKILFGGGVKLGDDEFLAKLQELNLLPVPLLEPAEISSAVLWLVSDEAQHVTGITLPIDAGAVLR
jgi:SDR family mycofactocin-dependent oxidoreductase